VGNFFDAADLRPDDDRVIDGVLARRESTDGHEVVFPPAVYLAVEELREGRLFEHLLRRRMQNREGKGDVAAPVCGEGLQQQARLHTVMRALGPLLAALCGANSQRGRRQAGTHRNTHLWVGNIEIKGGMLRHDVTSRVKVQHPLRPAWRTQV